MSLDNLGLNSIVVIDCHNFCERKENQAIEQYEQWFIAAEVGIFSDNLSKLWTGLQNKCDPAFESQRLRYAPRAVMGLPDLHYVSLTSLAMDPYHMAFPKAIDAARLVIISDRHEETAFGQAYVDAAREQGVKAPVLAPFAYLATQDMPRAPQCFVSPWYKDQLDVSLAHPLFVKDASLAILYGERQCARPVFEARATANFEPLQIKG